MIDSRGEGEERSRHAKTHSSAVLMAQIKARQLPINNLVGELCKCDRDLKSVCVSAKQRIESPAKPKNRPRVQTKRAIWRQSEEVDLKERASRCKWRTLFKRERERERERETGIAFESLFRKDVAVNSSLSPFDSLPDQAN
jgi:hypothetical protein